MASKPDLDTVTLQSNHAVEGFAASVRAQIDTVLSLAPREGMPQVPAFDLSRWVFRLELHVSHDAATRLAADLGARLTRVVDRPESGREAGGVVGSWVDRNLLHHDAAAENRERLDSLAKAALSTAESLAAKHLDEVKTILTDAEAYWHNRVLPCEEIDAAEVAQGRAQELPQWCRAVLAAVRSASAEVDVPSIPS
jgi:hypothetical protein